MTFQNPTGQDPLWATEDEIAIAPVVEQPDPVAQALGILNGAVVNLSFALLDVSNLIEGAEFHIST